MTRETGPWRIGFSLGLLLALVPVGFETLAVLVFGHLLATLLDERSHVEINLSGKGKDPLMVASGGY